MVLKQYCVSFLVHNKCLVLFSFFFLRNHLKIVLLSMLLFFCFCFFSIGVEFGAKACFFLFFSFFLKNRVLSISFLSEQGVAGQESDPYTHTESSLPWECEESEE